MKSQTFSIICCCGAPMVMKDSRFGRFWSCTEWPDCDGKIGAHPDGRPLGIPANSATREARKAAHETFDEWWRSKDWSKGQAYEWLEQNAPKPHIAEMDEDECLDLIRLVEDRDDAWQ